MISGPCRSLLACHLPWFPQVRDRENRAGTIDGLSTPCSDIFLRVYRSVWLEEKGFDLILANLPYLPGKPSTLLEAGWLDTGEIILQFLREAPAWLKPEGSIQMVYSTMAALSPGRLVEEAESLGLHLHEKREFRGLLETYIVYHFKKRLD